MIWMLKMNKNKMVNKNKTKTKNNSKTIKLDKKQRASVNGWSNTIKSHPLWEICLCRNSFSNRKETCLKCGQIMTKT